MNTSETVVLLASLFFLFELLFTLRVFALFTIELTNFKGTK